MSRPKRSPARGRAEGKVCPQRVISGHPREVLAVSGFRLEADLATRSAGCQVRGGYKPMTGILALVVNLPL